MAVCGLVLGITLLVERGLSIDAERLHGFYGRLNPAWYMRGLAFIPTCLLLLYASRFETKWVCAFAIALLYILATIATGEIYISLSFLFGLFIFILITRLFNKKFLFIIFTSTFLLIVVLILNDSLINRLLQAVNNRFPWNPSSDYHDPMLAGILIGKDNIIFGIGPQMFEIFCQKEELYHFLLNYNINSCNSHPHNIYIQFFVETGIIGVSLYLILGIIILFSGAIYSSFGQFNVLKNVGISMIILYWWPISTYSDAFGAQMNGLTWINIGISIGLFKIGQAS
jgi:O-antigen ligase